MGTVMFIAGMAGIMAGLWLKKPFVIALGFLAGGYSFYLWQAR